MWFVLRKLLFCYVWMAFLCNMPALKPFADDVQSLLAPSSIFGEREGWNQKSPARDEDCLLEDFLDDESVSESVPSLWQKTQYWGVRGLMGGYSFFTHRYFWKATGLISGALVGAACLPEAGLASLAGGVAGFYLGKKIGNCLRKNTGEGLLNLYLKKAHAAGCDEKDVKMKAESVFRPLLEKQVRALRAKGKDIDLLDTFFPLEQKLGAL